MSDHDAASGTPPWAPRACTGAADGGFGSSTCFLPFVEEAYGTLPSAEQLAYQRLLAEEDTELLLWMTGRAAPLDPELSGIVAKIRAHAEAIDS